MRFTRRFFLQTTGGVAAACTLAHLTAGLTLAGGNGKSTGKPAGTENGDTAAPANTTRKGKTLIVIFLRGGADGLNLVVPHAEPEYYRLRPSLAIARPDRTNAQSALDLDGRFGLHPAMAPLGTWFDKKVCVAAHAIGYDKNTRSHFEEQDTWETAVVGKTLATDGWLNRHLASSTGTGTIRALAIGTSLPRSLRGPANAYAVRDIRDLALPGKAGNQPVVFDALSRAYARQAGLAEKDMIAAAGAETLEGISEIKAVMNQPYKPAATYPNNPFASKLQQAARLIKANIGLEVMQIDLDGWDTHQYQGTVTNGPFQNLAGMLAGGLDAFAKDMGDGLADCLVLTLSDFGRTVAENGSNGTDHGWGNALFAMGGPVYANQQKNPAKVLGKWPGLAPELLNDGRDLDHTTDFRDVIAEAVGVHLGNTRMDKILPGHMVKPIGFFA